MDGARAGAPAVPRPAPIGVAAVPAPPPAIRARSRRRLALALAVAGLLCGVAAALLWLVLPPAAVYESSATLLIDQVRAVSLADDAGLIDKLGRLRFKYAGIVTTQLFTEPLAQELGRPEPAVRGALFARVDPASLLMEVGARGGDPQGVLALAGAAAEHLTEYVRSEQAAAGVAPDDTYTMAIVTPATPAAALTGRSERLAPVAAIGAGILLLAALGTRLSARAA